MADELELASRVAQELEPAVADFAATVAGSPAHEVGELLADKVRLRRYRSQLKILAKAREETEKAGLPASAVPIKVLAPLLEYGSLEDECEEDMVERWANLLANAATDSIAEVPPSFPDILRQLEPVDAKMLDLMYEQSHGMPGRHGGKLVGGWSRGGFDYNLELPAGAVTQARLENLVRLGLAFHPTPNFGEVRTNQPVLTTDRIKLTAFGVAFVKACRAPVRRDEAQA